MCSGRRASTQRACAGSHQFHSDRSPADLLFDREANPEHLPKTNDDFIRHVVGLLRRSETKLCIRGYEPELRSDYLDTGATVLLERPRECCIMVLVITNCHDHNAPLGTARAQVGQSASRRLKHNIC